MFRVSSPRLLDVAILSLSLIGALAIVALSDWNGDWFVENGPFEMLQVGALLAACLLFGRASRGLAGLSGLLALGLALASLLFLVRELPRCASPFYLAGPCMPGDTKTFAYLLPLVLWAGLVWRNMDLGPRALRLARLRRLPSFVWHTLPLAIVAVLLAIGQFADGRNMASLEETAELAAYALMALAGLAAAQASDRRQAQEPLAGATGAWSRCES